MLGVLIDQVGICFLWQVVGVGGAQGVEVAHDQAIGAAAAKVLDAREGLVAGVLIRGAGVETDDEQGAAAAAAEGVTQAVVGGGEVDILEQGRVL